MATYKFTIEDIDALKKSLLLKSKSYSYVSILDSNNYTTSFNSKFEYVAGFGAKSIVVSNKWEELKALSFKKSWLFGGLSYDLKNQLEDLKSENIDGLDFPELCFFEPELLVKMQDGVCEIIGDNPEEFVASLSTEEEIEFVNTSIEVKPRISKEKYIKQVIQILNNIQLGDIFEVNFCQEFFAENVEVDPVRVFSELIKKSAVPFSSFLKMGDKYAICASPERFISKTNNRLISQPIKGTIRRGDDSKEDEALKVELRGSVKEQAENVMIVDLVRNDFSKIAKSGSVKVDELFGIQTFPQVHQMVSTVSCEVEDVNVVDIIKECFPMGSMTGAPKIRSMKLIETYESTKRGLYSGAIGYIDPNGDFDFNVVIRSILYNQSNKYLSFMVGGAITSQSNPQDEYNESLLKAKAIFEILESK